MWGQPPSAVRPGEARLCMQHIQGGVDYFHPEVRLDSTMAVEEITLNGKRVETLKELLRPGLKAVFIGLNPSAKSVEKGHYYQGRHGRRFCDQLRAYRILPSLRLGAEDDDSFDLGYGFLDLIRRPTVSSKDLTTAEKSAAVDDLAVRLAATADRPLIIFRYKEPRTLAEARLIEIGYSVQQMPSPYLKKEYSDEMMKQLRTALRLD